MSQAPLVLTDDDLSKTVSAISKTAAVLLTLVVISALIAGILSLNRTADLAITYGNQIGAAERAAGYAQAKAEDAILKAQNNTIEMLAMKQALENSIQIAEREGRLAQYQVDELKEWNLEHGLGLPPDMRKIKK